MSVCHSSLWCGLRVPQPSFTCSSSISAGHCYSFRKKAANSVITSKANSLFQTLTTSFLEQALHVCETQGQIYFWHYFVPPYQLWWNCHQTLCWVWMSQWLVFFALMPEERKRKGCSNVRNNTPHFSGFTKSYEVRDIWSHLKKFPEDTWNMFTRIGLTYGRKLLTPLHCLGGAELLFCVHSYMALHFIQLKLLSKVTYNKCIQPWGYKSRTTRIK